MKSFKVAEDVTCQEHNVWVRAGKLHGPSPHTLLYEPLRLDHCWFCTLLVANVTCKESTSLSPVRAHTSLCAHPGYRLMEPRGQRYLSSSTTLYLMFLRPGLSLIPELTEWLHWQANELWGPTCLPCTPELGLQTHPTTPHFLVWVLRIQMQVLMFVKGTN